MELATELFFSFQLMWRVMIYPILSLSPGNEGGKKVKKCTILAFFLCSLLSSYNSANCILTKKSSVKQRKVLLNNVFYMLSFKNLPQVMNDIFYLWRDGVIHLPTSSVYKMVLFPKERKKKTLSTESEENWSCSLSYESFQKAMSFWNSDF